MIASVVANQGHPKNTICLGLEVFGEIIIKSMGYFQEMIMTTMYYEIPTGLTMDLSANSKIIGVGLIPCSCKDVMVSKVMALIVAPRSVRVF